MAKKPVNLTAKNAKQAADRLNDLVEQGAYKFDLGVSTEYSITVSVNSDGTRQEEKEPYYRLMGFAEMKEGEELEALKRVKDEIEEVKKERDEMNRTLNLLNGKAFGPLSVFLLVAGLITFILGFLTLVKVLPLPEEQLGISIGLTIFGVLAIAGSIVASVFRGKKITELQADRENIEKKAKDLEKKEQQVDAKTPSWYKNAIWSYKGGKVYNNEQEIEIEK